MKDIVMLVTLTLGILCVVTVAESSTAEESFSPLVFSTLIGGEESDIGYSMYVDGEGYIYVTGHTDSPDFPVTEGSYNETYNRYWDIFVFKMSPDGSDLIYSTYIGGNNSDVPWGICVDDAGSAYVTGVTGSEDFPTTAGAYSESYNGGGMDGFILKLSSDGSTLEYSTYIGGSKNERLQAIAIDQHRNVSVTGYTQSTNFPKTPTAKDRTHNGERDAFYLRLSDDGSEVLASTFIGGGDDDAGYSIALDTDFNAYITGYTASNTFPRTGGVHDEDHNGYEDVFVTKVSHEGTAFLYSTFVGSTSDEKGYDIVLDNENNAYVTGYTESRYFPTTSGAYDRTTNGPWEDIFVFKLSPTGANLVFSTFIGGEEEEYGRAIAINEDNDVFVVGTTASGDFPRTPNAYGNQTTGVVLFALTGNGSQLAYSTVFGGWDEENAYDIFCKDIKICYVTGFTYSDDFPTTVGAFSESLNGDEDVYVLKMRVPLNTPPTASIDSITPSVPGVGDTVYFNGSGSDTDGHITAYYWHSSIDGNLSTSASFSITTLTDGDHKITFRVADNLSFWSKNTTYNLYVGNRPTATIDDISPSPALYGQLVHFNGSGSDPDGSIVTYEWKSDIDDDLSAAASFTDHPSAGNHTVSFRVQDDDGLWSAWVTRILNVVQPGAELPVATITSITRNPARQGEIVTFAGSGSHSVWNITQYAWISNKQGLLSQNATFSTSQLLVGTHTITFKVIDETGEVSQLQNRTLTIQPASTDDDGESSLLGNPIVLAVLAMVIVVVVVGGLIVMRRGGSPAAPLPPSAGPGGGATLPPQSAYMRSPPPPPPPMPDLKRQGAESSPRQEHGPGLEQTPPEMVTIECPSCQRRMRVPKLGRLQQIKCGSCGLEGDVEI